ncbi:unnamed protein product [Rhizopus stolonifer]
MINTRQRRPVDYTLGICFKCNGTSDFGIEVEPPILLKCHDCHRNVHSHCSGLNETATEIVQTYNWQCNDCKSCLVCLSKNDENKIVFCNNCDRGYHTFCCSPPLNNVPKDDWYCTPCSSMPSPPSSPNKSMENKYKLRKCPSHSTKYLEMKRTKRLLNHGTEPKTPTKKVRLRLTVTNESKKVSEPDEDYFATFGHKLSLSDADIQRGIAGVYDKECFDSTMSELSSEMNDVPKIKQISFGNHTIDTWYLAPYPEEYSQSEVLYMCEYCMKYMKSQFVAKRHQKNCTVKHPPGDEIYRDGAVSVFEVDGRKNKMYCQNLCLLAKMFLDHKTLYYDVEPFLFYIMTEVDERGCHFVGYFSKEKRSALNYNVSCILTMPIYQRKGYGQFLIDFSYVLSKKESKVGTPERPLSELGLLSYRSYWKTTVFKELQKEKEGPISVEEMSNHTGLTPDDIISTLEMNKMLHRADKTYYILITPQVIESHLNYTD